MKPWSPQAVTDALSQQRIVVVWAHRGGDRPQSRLKARALCAELLQAAPEPACEVSRSAANGLAVVALHPGGIVGIDVENDPIEPPAEAPDFLHSSELRAWHASVEPAAFLMHVWCRKEAALKALGVGLSVPPGRFATGSFSTVWQLVQVDGIGQVNLRSIDSPTGSALAVSVSADCAPGIDVFGP